MTSVLPRAPDGLKPAGRAFWRKITSTYDLSPAEVALLARCCRTLDVLAEIDRTLAREGLVVTGSQRQPRPHPLLGSLAELQRTLGTLITHMALPMPGEAEAGGAARSRPRRRRRAGVSGGLADGQVA